MFNTDDLAATDVRQPISLHQAAHRTCTGCTHIHVQAAHTYMYRLHTHTCTGCTHIHVQGSVVEMSHLVFVFEINVIASFRYFTLMIFSTKLPPFLHFPKFISISCYILAALLTTGTVVHHHLVHLKALMTLC